MGFLAGKRALIVGVASDRSIAWGIAKAMRREGAELAFTYQNEKLKERAEKFAEQTQSNIIFPCDLGDDGADLLVAGRHQEGGRAPIGLGADDEEARLRVPQFDNAVRRHRAAGHRGG